MDGRARVFAILHASMDPIVKYFTNCYSIFSEFIFIVKFIWFIFKNKSWNWLVKHCVIIIEGYTFKRLLWYPRIPGGYIFVMVFVDSHPPRIDILYERVSFLSETEDRRIHKITSPRRRITPTIHENWLPRIKMISRYNAKSIYTCHWGGRLKYWVLFRWT